MATIQPSEWALFYKLLSNLLAAGYTPVDSLSQLMKEPFSQPLQRKLQPLLTSLPSTASLVDCLRLKTFALDTTTLDLFEKSTPVKEQCDLLQALSARHSQTGWMDQLRGNSLYWPLLYFAVGGGVAALIIYKVLPSFAQLYEDSNSKLPVETSLLLEFRHGFLLLILLAVAIFLALRFRPMPLRGLIDRLRLIRPWGILVEKIALARFTHMLTLLLSKKIAPRHALIMAAPAAENSIIELQLQRAFTSSTALSQTLDTPASVAGILKSCPLVPGAFIAAISTAEKTQNLEEALPELTEMSADLLFRHTQALNNRIDIASKTLVALLFGWVVFAVYQPLFSIGVLI